MAESDAFSCFSIFMTEMKDNYFSDSDSENEKVIDSYAMKMKVS